MLLEITCRWCGRIFCLCRQCWRGHAYCCRGCSSAGKYQVHREAQRRYRKTFKGREAHRKAQRRRRMRVRVKTLADRASNDSAFYCTLDHRRQPGTRGRCYFCGRKGLVVKRFPRQDYGRVAQVYKKKGNRNDDKENTQRSKTQTY